MLPPGRRPVVLFQSGADVVYSSGNIPVAVGESVVRDQFVFADLHPSR
jgi:hypothetical protein